MAKVDVFLKLDGVEGEAHDSVHAKEIDVLSFNWGETNGSAAAAGGGSGKGKFQLRPFTVRKLTCKASPVLAKICASGRHIPTAVLSCRKAGLGQKDYLVYHFKEVFVTSYDFTIDETHVLPIDVVTFSATYMEMEYKPQDGKGGLGGGVKFGVNTKTTEII